VINLLTSAEGGVKLTNSNIGVNLSCRGGQFVSRGQAVALNANSAKIGWSVFLYNRFKAEGGVDFTFATIGGDFDCSGGQFVSKGKAPALNATDTKIDGSFYFRWGAAAEGEVLFAFTSVARNFQWWGVQCPEKATLDLRLTKVGTLFNDQNSWPKHGELYVDGFVYDQIDHRASPTAEVQLRWLHRQPQDPFSSQPYQQLAAVLRERGLKEDAQKVMIEKNKDYAAHRRRGGGFAGTLSLPVPE
jgi:hypothetical protein